MQATLISQEQLYELVETIWGSMLSLPVAPAGGDFFVRDAAGLTASVQITGAWHGCVLLLPTESFARRATAIMLDQPEAELQQVDLLDAVAELCNMIGGGVKSLVPGPSTLSLPSVMQGTQFALRMPKTHLAAQLAFTCDSQPMEVRVLEGATAAH